MKAPRISSLHHLARSWNSNPQKISRGLVKLAEHPPRLSYRSVRYILMDLIGDRTPLEQAVTAIQLKEKHPAFCRGCIEIVKLAHSYFSSKELDYVMQVQLGEYPISQDLRVPFEPPLMYSEGGEMVFP